MRFGAVSGLVTAAIGLFTSLPAPAGETSAKPARAGVASESRLVSREALAVLRAGGNATDAAITAALVAGVVSPSSSGLGGGGFALSWQAGEARATILDFRETAPGAVDVEAFERRPLPASERGKLVGVPAESIGLAELHRRFGKRPWRELVAPAERLARDGFPVEAHLASVLADQNAANYRRMASVEQSFWPGGKLAVAGTRVKRPKLAKTLGRLATEGPRAIQAGPIAQDVVTAVRALGGALSRDDLSNYRVRERTPLRLAWEGNEVLTMPPPSAGGVFLVQVLGSFGATELSRLGAQSPLRIHLLAETMRGAIADRARYLGDPDFLPIDVEQLFAPARLAARRASSHPERTRPVRALAAEDRGTHAIVVADASGNVVSLTTTVNSGFGAEIEGEASGIVLNDELDDFASKKSSRELGVLHPPNQARPFARPASSMAPTLVLRGGRPLLVLGGSGGTRIPPNMVQVLFASLVDGATPEAALRVPRFRPQGGDFTLGLEASFSSVDTADLTRRGEVVQTNENPTSSVQLLSFGADGVRGAADPRKFGAALVY